MKVLTFKLVNGQEIVATLQSTQFVGADSTAHAYVLKKPHVLQLQQDRAGNVGMVFIPFTLSNPDLSEVTLPAQHVMFSFEPAGEVEKQYLSQTSGIDLSQTV